MSFVRKKLVLFLAQRKVVVFAVVATICVGVFAFFCPLNDDVPEQNLAFVEENISYPDDTIPPELLPQMEDQDDDIERNLISYTIQKGDTFADIARRYGLSVATLQAANADLSARRLRPGETIKVPPCDGVMVKVCRGDNLWTICRRHKANLDSTLAFNQIANVKSIRPGDNLFLPGGQIPVVKRTLRYSNVASSKSRSRNTPSGLAFAFPLRGRLTSRYGWRTRPMGPADRKHFHTGIDIAAPHGRAIFASEGGQVLSACYAGALGNRVVISHCSGYSTLYGHASRLLVKPGQTVSKGDKIALVGTTGRSTGPHVHFEVRRYGKHVDPLTMLK